MLAKKQSQGIWEIDVHNLQSHEALKKVLDKIEDAYFENVIELRVIHGFNRGTAIKNLILESEEIRNNEYVQRVSKSFDNSGITIITLKFHED